MLQAAASTAPGTGGTPFSPGSGGLPDLSSLFGGAVSGGGGGPGLAATGFGSPNFSEMQRQVCHLCQSVVAFDSCRWLCLCACGVQPL